MKQDSIAFRFIYNLYNTSCFGSWYTKRQLNRVNEKHPNGHSSLATFLYGDTSITVIPQNADNYSYLVACEETTDCVVIDVGDAKPVLQCLNDQMKTPQAVLVTHKHWDHCYGNKELKKRYKNLNFYGGQIDRPAGVNRYVGNEAVIEVGKLRFKALHVPGHTAGHMIYELRLTENLKCLFTGDFLFVAGIGKIFEGNPSQMIRSLLVLNDFPSNTLIFPGHEYAKLNLAFALSLEQNNVTLKALSKLAHEKRSLRLPIVPVTLGEECKINPYLRTNSLKFRKALVAAGYSVQAEATDGDDCKGNDDEVIDRSLEAQVAVFDALKKAKNDFIEKLSKQMEEKGRHIDDGKSNV